MNTGFLPHKEITNPKDLFGREQLLKQLQQLANNRNTVSIIGLRRFGKTSILKCLEFSLSNDPDANVYPLYFDFKEVSSIVKGTENVYRYMIAKFVERLFIDNHFTHSAIFKKKKIKPSDDWTDVFEDLKDVNPVRIQSLFEEIVSFFSEYVGKTVIFFFDEYEHLFRFSFDQPEGFMKLRNFSSKVIHNNILPFSFFVCGAISWEHLCTITGSGELNCIDHSTYIAPIDKGDFESMWISEANKIENCNLEILNGTEYSFQSSGGVPFYAKIIGSNWVIKNKKPPYFILKSYFQEMLNSLTNEEQSILNELAKGPKNYKPSKYVSELFEKGLITKNGGNFEIRIGFLKEYIMSIQNEQIKSEKVTTVAEELTEKIANLIITINKTNKTKKGTYIFEPINDEAALLKDLRTSCISAELFSDFANSLYKIVFERTKKKVAGSDIVLKKLPSPFSKGYQFIDIVDIMRHSLGGSHLEGTFTYRPGQMRKEQMLKILINSRNEPNTPEEFLALQIATLGHFETELNKLNAIVRSYP